MAQQFVFFGVIIVFFTIIGKASATKSAREIKYGQHGSGYIQGFVSHGINNYYGTKIVDLSAGGFGFIWDSVMYETNALNFDGDVAISPDQNTDPDTPLAMGRRFTEDFSSDPPNDITPNEALFNKPYLDIGTVTSNSTSIDDRLRPLDFNTISKHPSDLIGSAYFPFGTNTEPTLRDWDDASGLVQINCDDNGVSTIKVRVCHLLPVSIYTVWEVGIKDPGPNETAYWHAAGGVASVIRTDYNGYGQIEFKMPWCPVRECIPGQSIDCQIYFSVYHHSDYLLYGGDASGMHYKPISYPSGIVGGNHLWFPLHGVLLQEPRNKYNKHACKK